MREPRTKERLLEAACAVFAANGYDRTTVAAICKEADANIAAVNYYFRTKDSLYHSAWEHARNQTDAAYPPPDPDASLPEDALRAHIANRVRAIFDAGPAGWFPKILQHEMHSPTTRSEELREEFLYPRMRGLRAILRRIFGPDASDTRLRCCAMNILSLYAFLNIGKHARQRLFDNKNPTEDEVNSLILQMQDFALAGVERLAVSTENST